jgi:D-alanyl-lipoteichoic acid acyltransferase DltB (MBOAT superfamily)
MKDTILFETLYAVAVAIGYLLVGYILLRHVKNEAWRRGGFAILNLLAVYVVFFTPDWGDPFQILPRQAGSFVAYVALAILHFLLLSIYQSRRTNGLYMAALWSPVVLLVAVKIQTVFQLAGVSYLAFRMSSTAMETYRDPEFKFDLMSYVGFLFFLPTMSVGPISPLKFHLTGFQNGNVTGLVVARGLGRIVVGYVMFKLLAPAAQQLNYTNLWMDGFKHNIFGFAVASYANLAFLFFNFSGACHMAIGVASILGFPVKENFDNPLLSRSVKDFWNRWHISLSEFVRDLVFTPISLSLTRKLGPDWSLTPTLVAAMITFAVVGLWHGLSVGFFIFGILHGAGFCVNIAFEAILKARKLSRHWVLKTTAWRVFASILTLTYISMTTIFMTAEPFKLLEMLH